MRLHGQGGSHHVVTDSSNIRLTDLALVIMLFVGVKVYICETQKGVERTGDQRKRDTKESVSSSSCYTDES